MYANLMVKKGEAMQKVVIIRPEPGGCQEDESASREINRFLSEGWKIQSVTAQHIAPGWKTEGISNYPGCCGAFLIVLERNEGPY